jgi:hypothetical protein
MGAVFMVHCFNGGKRGPAFRFFDNTAYWFAVSLLPPIAVPLLFVIVSVGLICAPLYVTVAGGVALVVGMFISAFSRDRPPTRSYRRHWSRNYGKPETQRSAETVRVRRREDSPRTSAVPR